MERAAPLHGAGPGAGAARDRPVRAQPARRLRDRRGRRPAGAGTGQYPAGRPGPCRNHGLARCRRPRPFGGRRDGVRHAGALLASRPHRPVLRRADCGRRRQRWWPPCPTPIPWWPARASPACAPRASRWWWAPARRPSRELNIGFFSRMVRRHALGAHEGRRLAGRQDRAGQRRQPVDHLAKPRAPTAMPGAPGPGRCSPASAPCWKTIPGSTCGMSPTSRQPDAVVVDSRLETPLDAKHLHGRAAPLHLWRRAGSDPPGGAGSAGRHGDLPARPGRQGRPGRPCCATWPAARSTNCTWRRATSSMAR